MRAFPKWTELSEFPMSTSVSSIPALLSFPKRGEVSVPDTLFTPSHVSLHSCSLYQVRFEFNKIVRVFADGEFCGKRNSRTRLVLNHDNTHLVLLFIVIQEMDTNKEQLLITSY